MDEKEFFKNKKADAKKLADYGFSLDGVFIDKLADGQLELRITVKADSVSTVVTDILTGDEYSLHKNPNSVGAFVGKVRGEYEARLTDVAEKCFFTDVFKTRQAREIIEYVCNTYGDELEFLWKRHPENAVFRRKDTAKWYAAMLIVSKNKLGFPSEERVEIIDLRVKPDELTALLDSGRYLPGYHMNKKSWYTAILDGTVPSEELFKRIDESYLLAIR